jgi:uncharacterized protein YdeI (YjbR/CyaY-like superfamily)
VTRHDVEVDVEINAEPPVVVEPVDFARALDADPVARKGYDSLAYSHNLQHERAIESAKRPWTRARQIQKAAAMLGDRDSAGGRAGPAKNPSPPGPARREA